MSITVGDELMTGDITQHNAGRWRDETGEVWVVSWLPMRQLDRNQAITALTIAETVDSGGHLTSDGAAMIADLAAELGMGAQEAIDQIRERL